MSQVIFGISVVEVIILALGVLVEGLIFLIQSNRLVSGDLSKSVRGEGFHYKYFKQIL